MSETKKYNAIVESDIGFWIVSANEESITTIVHTHDHPDKEFHGNALTARAALQLVQYFMRERTTFDLPLQFDIHSPFFIHCWKELQKVPYGRTISYSHLARMVKNPLAVRAVGMANAKNPFPIVVPCHRVIGKNQDLTGYLYGINVKRWLLEHEGALAVQGDLFG
ncbi:MAG: methylated-DNA--[protein]-cysteine S-methyltransferase [Saprospiraceae bacterium]|nr:methylated-DNA--[protein]-cysteine S-methyltransferase [Bacteroidia bacterium]NNF22379.1 methylated-DNA--[protein]-cysteine S-methyltransferase [Saprospiraceae bacterium]NNK90669.1 methylated-DNA--[protein]-cysteine S-methyltransferase [Saprospiraceae bacterium]